MDSSGYESICNWVLETEASRKLQVDTNHPADYQAATTNPPNPFFESIRAAERRQSADDQQEINRSHRDRSTLKHDGPLTNSTNKEKHGYERRPRHKTREDRYEYKGHQSNSKVMKVNENKKRKSSKRTRKHTINDDFHASNVPTNRLTVHSNPHLGIFQKGKTSSPVKSRELPDLTFSEMNFLSRKSLPRQDEKNDKIQKHASNRQIPEYLSNRFLEEVGSSYTQKASESISNTKGSNMQAQAWSPVMECQSLNIPQSRIHGNNWLNGSDHQFGNQRQIGIRTSATPYSCSENKQTDLDIEPSIETYVMGLLHANTNLQELNDEVIFHDTTTKYWTLEELKFLLEDRMKSWDLRTEWGYSVKDLGCSEHFPRHKRRLPTDFEEDTECSSRTNDLSRARKRSKKSFREEWDSQYNVPHTEASLSGGKFTFDNKPQYSGLNAPQLRPGNRLPEQACQLFTQDQEFTSLPGRQRLGHIEQNSQTPKSRPVAEMGHFDTHIPHVTESGFSPQADDELFVQTLDMAYNAIMASDTPRCQSPLLSDSDFLLQNEREREKNSMFHKDDQNYHLPCATYLPNSFHSGLPDNEESHSNIGQAPQKNPPYSLSSTLSPGPNVHGSNPLMWQQHVHPAGVNTGIDIAPFGELTGFWRQNKL